MVTRVELVSDVPSSECPQCGGQSVREAVLVNQHGLVLARGMACLACGHRHRLDAGMARAGRLR